MARIEEHLDGCSDCRALVAGAAAALTPVQDDDDDDGERPPDGRIGRYLVGARLGGGAMGVVYQAEDPELHRRVALKLLRPGTAGDEASARLLREAQALARMTHENVVSVFDAGTHEGQVFMALELVDGSDLRAWLEAAPRALAQVLAVLVAAGRGLAAAHAAGIVHRDFKPDNVLVGVDGRVRVTDFGLARGADDTRADVPPADLLASPLTHSHAVAGTPAYMAPEVLDGAPADPRSDQWSFCVTLFEALIGRRPFGGATLVELRERILAGEIVDPPRATFIPRGVRRVLLRGLARRPEDRFASLDDLLEALTHDRSRPARRVLAGAIGALLVTASALAGDALMRARTVGATRAEVTAASRDLDRALELRFQVFAALVRPTSVLSVMREVAGNVDRAEFGLGDAADDLDRLAELHEGLASADWSMWTRDGLLAIADYKGRLVYSSDAPARHGDDMRVVDAVARAYDPEAAGVSVTALRGDDPVLTAAGLVGAPRAGVVLVLARPLLVGGTPRAVLAQTIDGRRLLDDLSLGPNLRLAVVTPDGAFQGTVPAPVARRAAREPDRVLEIAVAGTSWVALARPIANLGRIEGTPTGTIVLARTLDVGGLFAHARLVLAIVWLALLVLAALASRRIWRTNRATT